MELKLKPKTSKNLQDALIAEAQAQELFAQAQEKMNAASWHRQALLEQIYESENIDYVDEFPKDFRLQLKDGKLVIPDRPVKAATRIKNTLNKKAHETKAKGTKRRG